jgi:hypothetical protein
MPRERSPKRSTKMCAKRWNGNHLSVISVKLSRTIKLLAIGAGSLFALALVMVVVGYLLAPNFYLARVRHQRPERNEGRRYKKMVQNRSEGLLVKAYPLEQAERISRSMVEVRVVDGALLLDADPTWAGAINTVLVKKGVRVSELCLTAKDEPEATLRGREGAVNIF